MQRLSGEPLAFWYHVSQKKVKVARVLESLFSHPGNRPPHHFQDYVSKQSRLYKQARQLDGLKDCYLINLKCIHSIFKEMEWIRGRVHPVPDFRQTSGSDVVSLKFNNYLLNL